jgi:hypothetical protein
LLSVTILAEEPPGFVDKEKIAGDGGKSEPFPCAAGLIPKKFYFF